MAKSALVQIGVGKGRKVLCRDCAEDRGYGPRDWEPYTEADYLMTIDVDSEGPRVCQDCGLVAVDD